jgi:cytochrome c-type biogenesis protein
MKEIITKISSITTKISRWDTFIASVFFVLGFSLIFSILGILLQTVLSSASYSIQIWLGRIGGVIIILFGLFLLKLIQPTFLIKEHKFRVKRRFNSTYATSFVFGAAFAVGWTPCVSAALGAILALAATQSSSAFFLLMAYTLGLGLPFLVVGAFTQQAARWINKAGKWLQYAQYVFGVILIGIGILVFTSQLVRIANIPIIVDLLLTFDVSTGGSNIMSLTIVNIAVAFFAGLVSFLSPCVLPLIPGFLSFLATTAVREKQKNPKPMEQNTGDMVE